MSNRPRKNSKNKSKKSKIISLNEIDLKQFNSNASYRRKILNIVKYGQFKFSPQENLKNLKTLSMQFKNLLKSNLFLSDIKLLNNGDLGYYIEDLELNLMHMLNLFSLYSKKIDNFLCEKKKFEKEFLLGDLKGSDNTLNKIVDDVGYTNWSLQSKFLIEEYRSGFEANFKFLKGLTSKGAHHPLNGIFIFSFSRMAEKDLAIDNYKKNLELDYYSFYNVSYVLKQYLKVYIEPDSIYEEEDLNGIFVGEYNNPLIDQYLTFKKILVNLLSKKPKLCEKILLKSIPLINDIQLKKILFLINGELGFYKETDESLSTMQILDFYTEGNYIECIENIKEHIKQYEISVDLVEIYVKSYINLNLELELFTKDDSTLNYITENINNILYKNNKTDESINKLKICAFSLHNFDISIQLSYFLNKVKPLKNIKSFVREHQIYLPVITPKIIHNFEANEVKIRILKTLETKSNKTINFFKKLLKFEQTEIINELGLNIPKTRLLKYTSTILFNKDKYQIVIDNLTASLPKLSNTPHIYESYLLMIYKSYSRLKKYQECINLYVNNYFKNKYLLNNIKTDIENSFITDLGYKELEKNIDLILFIHICKIESKILFLVYRLFMREIHEKIPSLMNIDNYSSDKIIYFLRYICVQEVLSKDVVNFKTLTQVESERLKICQLLVSLDPKNSKVYNQEITEITQNIHIKERMREVEYGKIHVDIKGLINYDLKDFDTNFTRFKRIRETSEDIYKIVTNQENNSIEGDIQNYRKKIVTQEEQLRSVYLELFIEIRDKYLFSNEHGLDSYLSTRIRHGTITGQFRKIFNELNLITKKDSESKTYQDNFFWIKKLELNEEELKNFNKIMNQFSKELDDYITYIKDNFIQIETEGYSKALFDFNIRNFWGLLENHFEEFKNFDNSKDFIDKSIVICNFMTDWNLERIKIFFNTTIKENFFNLINNLETEITNINLENKFLLLLSNIRKSRTEIQITIDTVSSWFERKEIKHVNFTLSDVIDTNKELIKNIFNSITLNVHLTNNNNDIFEGRYFISFVDCFKIFLENIINYIQEKNENTADVFIDVVDSDEYFTCTITNELINFTDDELEIIDKKIENKENEIKEATRSIANRREGNTGIIKATKILNRAFNNPNNTIAFKRIESSIVIEFRIYKKGLVYENSNN